MVEAQLRTEQVRNVDKLAVWLDNQNSGIGLWPALRLDNIVAIGLEGVRKLCPLDALVIVIPVIYICPKCEDSFGICTSLLST